MSSYNTSQETKFLSAALRVQSLLRAAHALGSYQMILGPTWYMVKSAIIISKSFASIATGARSNY